ncbi:hypothetical protein [Kingella oralis]|uniref:hypothetical protein n=1 Tax=Kingella oralis TaxID=505 RepID=UPI0034E617C9
MLKLVRTFHPVGQGAFYSERFYLNDNNIANIVYDCGSDTCKKTHPKIKSEIEKLKDSNIDILFISHFDEDHINLIHELKSCVKEINKVVMPLLDNKEIDFLTTVYEFILSANEYKFFKKLIKNPEEIFIDSIIIKVKPVPEEENNTLSEELPEEINSSKEINSGHPIILKKHSTIHLSTKIKYGYIPYHFYSKEKIDKRRNAFLKYLGATEADLKNIELNDEEIKKIKDAYNELEGSMNNNSLIIYAGILHPHNLIDAELSCYINSNYKYNNRYSLLRCYFCNTWHNNNYIYKKTHWSGILYTGDLGLSATNVEKYLGDFVKGIGVIQVPHHGGKSGFSIPEIKALSKRDIICPISHGQQNKYQHPCSTVIFNLIQSNFYPISVTEDPDTIFQQTLYLYDK